MSASKAVTRRLGRWISLAMVASITLVAAASIDDANARGRRKHGGGYKPPYAAVVIDHNTGEVLHATNADAPRHPASLTKMMTLYMLFEQLDAGRFKLDSEFKVSAHAASQAPSKLGLRPGTTIEAEDAIKALVTKSANDAAVVIAEAIAGDEDDFAQQMTRKARAIGMSRTTFKNASGLPDSEQITTARDMVTLGRALQDRFPRYYKYFQTSSFQWAGRSIRNHNKLLGRVEGVDGIKTGYTRASGFNLVTSMKRGNRQVVASVLGGPSGGWRDARMTSLIKEHIQEASAKGRTVPKPVEVAEAAPMKVTPGSTDPIKPNAVRTISVQTKAMNASMLGGASPKTVAAKEAPAAEKQADKPAPATTASTERGKARGDWLIQIGAFPEKSQAEARIEEAKSHAKRALSNADPFTEKVQKGKHALYRARFAGFDRERAEEACKLLKKNDFACLPMRN